MSEDDRPAHHKRRREELVAEVRELKNAKAETEQTLEALKTALRALVKTGQQFRASLATYVRLVDQVVAVRRGLENSLQECSHYAASACPAFAYPLLERAVGASIKQLHEMCVATDVVDCFTRMIEELDSQLKDE